MVTEPTLDPERLAALIDGTLDDPERARLIELPATSELHREVLADAAAAMGEGEEYERVAAATPTQQGLTGA